MKLIRKILSLALSILLSFIFFKLYTFTPQGYEFITAFVGGAFSVMLVVLFDTYFDLHILNK